MNKIKRLPTLEEVNLNSYRELFNSVKNLPGNDSVFQVVPPHIIVNPEALNYPVFEFTLDEVKDAYLEEMETRLEYIKSHADAAKPKGDYASDMAEAQAVLRIISNNLEKYF